MFDVGWTELMVIGVVALIVVGPKDLPVMFHRLGQFTARARGMAREFQRAMDDAAKEAGVKDMSRDLRNLTSPSKLGLDALRDATRELTSLDPRKGPATAKLSEERAEKAALIREATAKAGTERKAAEAAKAAAPVRTGAVVAKAAPPVAKTAEAATKPAAKARAPKPAVTSGAAAPSVAKTAEAATRPTAKARAPKPAVTSGAASPSAKAAAPPAKAAAPKARAPKAEAGTKTPKATGKGAGEAAAKAKTAG